MLADDCVAATHVSKRSLKMICSFDMHVNQYGPISESLVTSDFTVEL